MIFKKNHIGKSPVNQRKLNENKEMIMNIMYSMGMKNKNLNEKALENND